MGKLEGPKKHHDKHGMNASVPGKGKSAPGEHWEMKYSTCNPGKDMEHTKGSAFAPKQGKNRMTAHNKVNETDH